MKMRKQNTKLGNKQIPYQSRTQEKRKNAIISQLGVFGNINSMQDIQRIEKTNVPKLQKMFDIQKQIKLTTSGANLNRKTEIDTYYQIFKKNLQNLKLQKRKLLQKDIQSMNTDQKQGLKNYLYHNRSQIDNFSSKKLEKLYDNKIPDWYDVPEKPTYDVAKKPTRPPPTPPTTTTILSQKKQTRSQKKKQTSQQQNKKKVLNDMLSMRKSNQNRQTRMYKQQTNEQRKNLLKQRNILDQIKEGKAGLKKTTQTTQKMTKQQDDLKKQLHRRRKDIAGKIDSSSDEDTDSDDSESIFD